MHEGGGIVVWVDGADGSGKTSIISSIASAPGTSRIAVTQEFSSGQDKDSRGRATSQELRDMAVDASRGFDLWERQLAMLIASRRHNRLIVPALAASADLVLVDRSPLTFTAYGASLGEEFRRLLKATLVPVAHADVKIFLDGDADRLWSRRRPTQDAVDALGPSHHRRVVEDYRAAVASEEWGYWEIVDADEPFDFVVDEVRRCIGRRMRHHPATNL